MEVMAPVRPFLTLSTLLFQLAFLEKTGLVPFIPPFSESSFTKTLSCLLCRFQLEQIFNYQVWQTYLISLLASGTCVLGFCRLALD